MGDVIPITPAANDDATLFEQFADRVVTAATSLNLPAEPIARALLAKSINMLIDEMGEAGAAQLLGALALRLSPELGGAA